MIRRIIYGCQNELLRVHGRFSEGTAWTFEEFFTEFTKVFIEQRSSGHSRAIAWKTLPGNQFRCYNLARKIMINVEQDGTLSTFLQIDEVAPNLPALREREQLRNEWHYIPEVLTKQWKDAVKVKKSFFSLELYNEGKSIGAHLFIVAKILVAHWICKSIESGEHETLTSADHNEILHFQMTETVKLSYLWENKANALDCIKKVDAKLFLPAIVKAGGFTDVNSVRGVGRKAESIADQYIEDYRSGKCPANAKPCQCGELWAAILPAYNFEHWKAFMNDATCDLLPTDAICPDSLEDEKQML